MKTMIPLWNIFLAQDLIAYQFWRVTGVFNPTLPNDRLAFIMVELVRGVAQTG